MLKKMRLGGIVLASLLAVTGCQNEEIVSNEQQKGNYSLKVSSLVDSRTYVENDGTVKWSKGDKLYVYGEGVSGVLTLDDADAGETTGTFTGFVFGDPDDLKWAVFGDEVKGTANGAQFTISSITDPNSNSPMVGEIEGGNVEMEHLCGMVRITINNLPEGADVKLSGDDIAGTAEVKDGELSTSVSYESEITIKVAAGNQTIEVPVFASETESVKEFTLTIDNATFEFSAPIAVGKLSQDAIMNFDCVVNEETGKVEGFAIEVGTEEALYNALQTGIGESVSISLNKDIVLTGTWTPIGDKDTGKYFTGTLDGKGHTISGLSVSTGDYVSLISAAKDATIKNLTVEGSVTGDNAAGIVARVEGNSVIEDCISNVVVNGTTKAGGITSNVTGANAKIINCVNNGAISCSKEAAGGVGGIIGYVNNDAYVEIISCTNNGDITGTNGQTTGAVVGYAAGTSSGLIVSFTNAGEISGSNYENDGNGRWIENENGLILAGYCGTPANWTKSTIVDDAEESAGKLTSDSKNIAIELSENMDLPISQLGTQTGGSGEYKLGGENTENIIIDLKGKKLNITTTYMSSIGAKNENATITIRNGSITSTGNSAGTWNIYDLTFANCNYIFEDVVFDKSIAFTNTGKSVVMKNVAINETHDYYALWISARGQNITIDDLTINSTGRGIKIDEQYVSTPAKVSLAISNAAFNTKNKAAIMVKSVAGADITLDEVDISGVEADVTNAVWVDKDSSAHASEVAVTGGSIIVEP